MSDLVIVGGGLAGSEAAWQAARRGLKVVLYEMRPGTMTPAHRTGNLAELVCSNSLRSDRLENAVGLLKEEMRRLGSLIIAVADDNRIPAGGALAVDREGFAAAVTGALAGHPGIEIRREEVREVPSGTAIIASGPLTSTALAGAIRALVGSDYLSFYDAAAPIVYRESLNMDVVFRASRYGRGEDYFNCPLNEEQYETFWRALVGAQIRLRREFEPGELFEGCMPVEEIARRGKQTLLFGPLKPVGLVDPRTGRRPHAVVQLRQDDRAGYLYNLVGFQTNLTWPEQRRVFRLIPGLERAEFARYGVMHRNLFINSPALLLPTLQMAVRPQMLFAGQITGVEGYVESAAGGLVAGINAARLVRRERPLVFPPETMLGALCAYITSARPDRFQPMNAAFGLLPPLPAAIRDRRRRNLAYSERALAVLGSFAMEVHDPAKGT